MKKILLLFILLLTSIIEGEGFIAGTLIKCPNGYIPIEKLKKGDSVICFDSLHGSYVETEIINVSTERVSRLFKIIVGNETITAAKDHRFYLPTEQNVNKKWIRVDALYPGAILLKNDKDLISVTSIEKIEEQRTVYNLVVNRYHNFYVSTLDINVHNDNDDEPMGFFKTYCKYDEDCPYEFIYGENRFRPEVFLVALMGGVIIWSFFHCLNQL